MEDLIFFKPVGICTVLLKSLILNNYCEENNLTFKTYIQSKHREVLDIIDTGFNIDVTNYKVPDTKGVLPLQRKIIKSFYKIHHLDDNERNKEIDFFYNSDLDSYKHRGNPTLVVDFIINRNNNAKKLSKINTKITALKTYDKLDKNTNVFNLVNPLDEEGLYEMWEMILKKISPKKVFFVSGNKKMLHYFNEKYSLKTNDESYETSKWFGRNMVRGSAKSIIIDSLKCSTGDFWDFQKIISAVDIPKKYWNLTCIDTAVKNNYQDSFDLFVKYLQKNLQ